MGIRDEPIYYVYQLRVSDEHMPFYVGKGKNNRATRHLVPSFLNRRSYKNSIIKAALRDGKSVEIEMLEQGLTDYAALEFERFFISAYGRRDKGTGVLVNMTDGGDGCAGHVPSLESRQKMSKNRAGIPVSEERKRHLSRINTGAGHPKFGKKESEETCRRKSLALSGEKNPMFGRTVSDEHKMASRLRSKGENNRNCVLTEQQVLDIYELITKSTTRRLILERFPISKAQLYRIQTGESWNYLYKSFMRERFHEVYS